MSIKPKFGFYLEYVNDIETAKAFFTDIMGLEMERYHPTFVQFKNFAIASDASMSGKREPELYWLVEDAEMAFEEFRKKAEVVMPIKQMPFGKVFAIQDPAGRPQYILEFARERPSKVV